MKKLLVYSLILTMIFPAYCFGKPTQAFPTEREILEEIMYIIEDGIVEEGEVFSFLQKMDLEEIASCTILYGSIFLIVRLMSLLDFSRSLPLAVLNVFVVFFGLYVILFIYLLGGELDWC